MEKYTKELNFIHKCEEILDNMMDLLFTGKNLNYMQIVEAEDTILRLQAEFFQILLESQERLLNKTMQIKNQNNYQNSIDKEFILLTGISSSTAILGFALNPMFFITSAICNIRIAKIIHRDNKEILDIDLSDFLLDNCEKLEELELRLDNYYQVLQEKEYKFYVDTDKAYIGNEEKLSEKDIYLISNVLNMLFITKKINDMPFNYKKEITDKMYSDLSTFLGENTLSYEELVTMFRDLYKEYYNGTNIENVKKLTKKIEES